jgi:hypothetical protein
LSGCETASCKSTLHFPVAGEKVAEELAKIPENGFENFWEWLGRLEKFKRQIEA